MSRYVRAAQGCLAGSVAAAVVGVMATVANQTRVGLLALGVALVLAWGAVASSMKAHDLDRQRLDELAELDALRADQASVLTHEIRTPLAVIQGAAELLLEQEAGQLTRRQAGFVHRIIDNSVRMSTFCEQLLTRARLEAGLFQVERSMVDLRLLFREVIDDLTQILVIPIVLEAPGAPVHANVDPQLIRQVLTNLINNAASSETASGRVDVRVSLGDGEAIVSVSDGGSGMSEEQRDRLFQRFTSGRQIGNGTGIGLFISQRFVELHGGRIYADTMSGKGTTMLFTLPVDPTEPTPTSKEATR